MVKEGHYTFWLSSVKPDSHTIQQLSTEKEKNVIDFVSVGLSVKHNTQFPTDIPGND